MPPIFFLFFVLILNGINLFNLLLIRKKNVMPNWLHFCSYTKGTLHKGEAVGFAVKTN